VLVAAVSLAASSGFGERAWQLSWALAAFLGGEGYWQQLEATQHTALEAARRLGDVEGQARAHRYLAKAMTQRRAYGDARTHLSAALQLARQLGSSVLEAKVHLDSGSWAFAAGGPSREGLSHAEDALRLYRSAGCRPGEAEALNQVGWEHAHLGDYREAVDYCAQALALFRDGRDRHGEALTLHSLGYAHLHLGHYADAVACYHQAIDVQGAASGLDEKAECLTHLGDALLAAGNPGDARLAWQRALTILDDLHHPAAGQVRSKLDRLPVPHGSEDSRDHLAV